MHKPEAEACDRLVEITEVQIERLRWGTPIHLGGEYDFDLIRERIKGILGVRPDLEEKLDELSVKLEAIDPSLSDREEFYERKRNEPIEKAYINFYELKGMVDRLVGYELFDGDRADEYFDARHKISTYKVKFKILIPELEELETKLDELELDEEEMRKLLHRKLERESKAAERQRELERLEKIEAAARQLRENPLYQKLLAQEEEVLRIRRFKDECNEPFQSKGQESFDFSADPKWPYPEGDSGGWGGDEE
ncbi:hypothetical protein HN512_02250 [Candidatus Peregrinibacteria bacterium]|jgi:hypothetical protein|nr:hypothetical protein [Candidatus Peregrinibacteria bacterium]MBT3598635.1 hypothetical protein [Candidatus Peregrinibacteria bacterium]MBT4367256.1 hypothetical protein [Candidatus Peregrinibacteria bacterium]MBT6730966.1 hypothetical protein [Candidatus Peregrinibacteria bacterium]MBT7009893.1 hypothetical protein [Candidatus Peregrinibacteria bacterium]